MKHNFAFTSMDFSTDLANHDDLNEPLFPRPERHQRNAIKGYIRFAAVYFVVSSLIALCVVSFASDFSLLEILLRQ